MDDCLPLQPGVDRSGARRQLHRLLLLIGLWVLAIMGGSLLDRPVSQWLNDSGIAKFVRYYRYAPIVKAPGTYYFTLALAAVVWLAHSRGWRAAALMLLTGVPALLNCFSKWVFGRARPFRLVGPMTEYAPFEPHWFIGGFPGLLTHTNLAFPSGHSCTAFATAAALAILWPRWRWAFYGVAAVVAIERVAENAHYVSDVIAGAGLGAFVVHLIARLFREFRTGRVSEPSPGNVCRSQP
jgi:membrane-associated phospholipid phosphatase